MRIRLVAVVDIEKAAQSANQTLEQYLGTRVLEPCGDGMAFLQEKVDTSRQPKPWFVPTRLRGSS